MDISSYALDPLLDVLIFELQTRLVGIRDDEKIEAEREAEKIPLSFENLRIYGIDAFEEEDAMTEYEVKGKAWDKSAVVETGRKFNR